MIFIAERQTKTNWNGEKRELTGKFNNVLIFLLNRKSRSASESGSDSGSGSDAASPARDVRKISLGGGSPEANGENAAAKGAPPQKRRQYRTRADSNSSSEEDEPPAKPSEISCTRVLRLCLSSFHIQRKDTFGVVFDSFVGIVFFAVHRGREGEARLLAQATALSVSPTQKKSVTTRWQVSFLFLLLSTWFMLHKMCLFQAVLRLSCASFSDLVSRRYRSPGRKRSPPRRRSPSPPPRRRRSPSPRRRRRTPSPPLRRRRSPSPQR